MTTVTGLTADRMLAIEGASVIDGDVDASGNLILTKHDGSKINAGSVVGPPGPQGPIGSDLAVLAAVPVLDVGMANQVRAGRQLSPADFAAIGLNAPAGLWNLSDLTDSSGNGRNLSNKGAVTFAPGINGVANTAAQFTGAVGQALYISDTGSADPFRLRTGSVGCWFRTAKRGTINMLVDKYGLANQQDYSMYVASSNLLQAGGSPDGVANTIQVSGVTDVADDRWHFGVYTFDGTVARVYLDGILEGALVTSNISLNPGASPLNIGARGADAATNAQFPSFGRIDEVFITQDVLSDDQVRNLYCAKLVHTLGAIPTRISVKIRRRRRGSAFVVSDFSTQPVRLHNFSSGSLADEGSNGQVLTNNGSVPVSGADGTAANSMLFYGPTPVSLSATDTGLPAALAARSMGGWIKTQNPIPQAVMGWGVLGTDLRFLILSGGNISAQNGGDAITGPNVADGQWHFVVVTEDNAAFDGVKRKLYLDGKLVAGSTAMNAIALGGANRFRIGANPDLSGTAFTGQIDGVFVTDFALTTGQILNLWAKGSQTLAPAPKNSGDHIEAMSATNLLAIFDTLDSVAQVDLAVA